MDKLPKVPIPLNIRMYMLKQRIQGMKWRSENRHEWIRNPKHAIFVYQRSDKLYVITDSQTVDGIWTHDGAASILNASCSVDELARVVRQHLSRSRGGLRVNLRETNNDLPKQAGLKSWGAFERGLFSVSVHREQTLRVTPYRTERGHRGQVPASTGTIELALDKTDEELCRAIRDGLEISRRES